MSKKPSRRARRAHTFFIGLRIYFNEPLEKLVLEVGCVRGVKLSHICYVNKANYKANMEECLEKLRVAMEYPLIPQYWRDSLLTWQKVLDLLQLEQEYVGDQKLHSGRNKQYRYYYKEDELAEEVG